MANADNWCQTNVSSGKEATLHTSKRASLDSRFQLLVEVCHPLSNGVATQWPFKKKIKVKIKALKQFNY